jgi:predicted small secreted protein
MRFKVLLVFALILVIFAVSGCQTVQGMGQDLTWTGQAGEEVINDMFDEPSDEKQYSEYDRDRSRYDY